MYEKVVVKLIKALINAIIVMLIVNLTGFFFTDAERQNWRSNVLKRHLFRIVSDIYR